MFIFIPKTKEHNETFVTDSLFLYFFYNLFHLFKRRRESK